LFRLTDKICSLPYPEQVPEYTLATSEFYRFCLKETWDENTPGFVTIGYILPSVVERMLWISSFVVDHDKRIVSIKYAPGEDVETKAISEQLNLAREKDSFSILRRWMDEIYRILDISREVRMERAGSALFGIHTVGVHIMAFCRDQEGSMKLWIPRRAATKTYPGMLDNTVGGGITVEEDQFECMLREAEEEASLPKHVVKDRAQAVGTIAYFYIRDARAGGETGLLQPSTHHLYDLELPTDVVPKPADKDVEEFYLWTPEETMVALREGKFKPNSAVAWIDFFIRHSYITAKNEPDYLKLVSRIHRRIHF
jgi:8-oxo-dGTP pyrophosphatase MutT (NUDIX family)